MSVHRGVQHVIEKTAMSNVLFAYKIGLRKCLGTHPRLEP
jgi:hypothetical protein